MLSKSIYFSAINFRRSINIDVKTKLPEGLYIGCSQKNQIQKRILLNKIFLNPFYIIEIQTFLSLIHFSNPVVFCSEFCYLVNF